MLRSFSVRTPLAVVTALLLLAGCSSTAVTPPASKVSAPEETVTTLRWGSFRGTQTEMMVDLLIGPFQTKYPTYRIEKVPFENSLIGQNQFLDKTVDGDLDLVPVSIIWLHDRDKYLRPLDGFLAKSRLDTAPYGSLLDKLRVDGEVLELPLTVNPSAFVYNTEMAAAAGVTIPREGWTWDEFRSALARLASGSGNTKVWGLETLFHEELARVWMEEKTHKPTWEADNETLLEMLTFFHTLSFTDQSMTPAPRMEISESTVSFNYSSFPFQSLNEKRAAISYLGAGSNMAHWRQLAKIPWDMAPMPTITPGAKPVLPVSSVSLGIPFNSAQSEAAWQFIAFAAGPEGAEILARAGYLPVYSTESVRKAWAEGGKAYPPGIESVFRADWVVDLTGGRAEGHGKRAFEFSKTLNWALSGAKTVENAMGYFTVGKPLP